MKKYIRRFYYWSKNLKYVIPYLRYDKNIPSNGILLITHDFERQGAPVLLLNMAKWFNERGIALTVLSTKYGVMMEDFKRYGTVLIDKKKNLPYIFKILHEQYGYKTAICNTVVTGLYTGHLKKGGYRVVSLIHELGDLIQAGNYEENCNIILNNADYIVFPSSYGYKAFMTFLKKDCNKNKVIIKNQGLFNVDERDLSKKQMRTRISKHFKYDFSGKTIILNVATACYRKGFDLFLDLAYLFRDDSQYCFIWVGDKTAAILTKKKREYSLEKFPNLFLPGYIIDKDLLNDLYGAADLFCLTSREEPFGSVVLESFKAGVPVLAFDGCGGYMDVVKKDITGYLVPKENVNNMEQCIRGIDFKGKEYLDISLNCLDEIKKHDFNSYCEFILRMCEVETQS